MLKLRSVLLNSKAAIDLASIMVGIIVIGLIGGVIAATVFAVIPWAQDSAAKQQLQSIHTAQNAAYGFSADPSRDLPSGQSRNAFTNSAGLDQGYGLLVQSSSYCTTAVGELKQDYRAYSKSGSGAIWFSSNGNKQASELAEGVPGLADCAGWVKENQDGGVTVPETPGSGGGNETEEPGTENPTEPETPGSGGGNETENPGGGITPDPEDTRVVYATTAFTLNCPAAVNANVLKTPLSGGVNGTFQLTDASNAVVASWDNNASVPFRLVANTEYHVIFNGTFTTLTNYEHGNTTASNACFRSMDAWATDSGTTSVIQGLSGMSNVTKVPESIPATVTSLQGMFFGLSKFNQDISNWDVSKVTNFTNLFYGATIFNQDVTGWDTRNVENMYGVFTNAAAFNQDVSVWQTSKVGNMYRMFFGATAFTHDVSKFDVTKVNSWTGFAERSGIASTPEKIPAKFR